MWRRSNQRFRTFLLNLFHVNSILTLILTGLRGSTALHLQSWGGRIARCVPRNKYASEKENLYAIYLREQRILTFQHNTHVGMEGARGGGTTSADGPELWSLNVTAHQLYIRRHLQRGLRMFCTASYAEEASITSSVRASADAVHVPFMELQQQQQSLLSGVYWTLCCLALLQPPAAVSPSSQEEHGPETTTLPLPPTVKECLISKVILPCLRRRQCSGWVSAAPDVVSAAMPAERGEGYGGSVAKEALSHRLGRPSPPTVAPTALGSGGHCRISALGFGSNLAGHATATALSTCSGLQALALLEALPLLSEGVLRQLRHFVLSLQRGEDGSFANTLSPICWSRWCSHCRETAAGAALPSAAAAMPSAAAANEEGTWENEGDVRCTFCCLLSLKLIHAAAKAHQKLGAASPPPQAGAVVAGAVDRAAEEASVSVTSAHSGAGDPAVCREGPTEPSPWLVQPTEGPLHGASWEAFLQDPFAGVRVDAMLSWLLSLVGPDGGVGVSPGAEPHAGAAFCFAGCVSLLGKWNALKIGEARRLERWLRERQLPEGSLQGRPGKKGDSCYTFWVTAALLLLGKAPLKVLESTALADAVAAAQHPSGGISRAPAHFLSAVQKCCEASTASAGCTEPPKSTMNSNSDNGSGSCNPLRMLSMGPLDSAEEQLRCPDPFHTFFALAGLSLLAFSGEEKAMQSKQQRLHMHQKGQERQNQQHARWQTTCKQLLQPLDPETALPLQLADGL